MTFLAATGAITLAVIAFRAVRQVYRDWGAGYPWMGIRR